MKKKISITMCLMTAVSVIITAVMISLVIYRKNYNEMKSMIRAEAGIYFSSYRYRRYKLS